ncbi:MAG: hypothetical protein K2X38_03420 [Gemmataceae bacterium]|nr:hypothetical protein [Gemmataceae bacterium]
MARGVIAAWIAIACAFGALATAQQPMAKDAKDAKAPPGVSKPGPEAKAAVEPSKAEPKKTPSKGLGVPSDALIAVLDSLNLSLKDLLSVDPKTLEPKFFLVPAERYLQEKARLAALEKQLKPDKRPPSACKLSGRAEGDLVQIRAEFGFVTESPNAQVFLGLQGAHLVDEGMLDRSSAVLEVGDEGVTAQVEREGTHQLVLNLRIPAPTKRSGTLGGVDRGFDLNLPGAAVTTFSFETPGSVKELKWNENVEKTRIQGKWELTLGKAKSLAVQWREPITAPGGGPLPVAEATAVVKILDSHIEVQADIVLEDLRGQTKEWVLLVPPQARVVKTMPALGIEVLPADSKNPNPILKLKEATFDRITATVQVRLPRHFPQQRLQLGPFAAQGVTRHQGTILVQSASDALRGQRPLFHRSSEMFQREPPAAVVGIENIGYFQYWDAVGSKGKLGLELELRAEKTTPEIRSEIDVVAKEEGAWRLLETTLRVQGKSGSRAFETLDVQVPPARIPGLDFVVAPSTFGIGGWTACLASAWGPEKSGGPAGGFFVGDDAEVVLTGSAPRRKATLPAANGLVVLRGKHWIEAGSDRVRLELPRPMGVVDRGGKESIVVPRHLELLVGPLKEPAAERHESRTAYESMPPHLEWAWRPYRPEITASMKADLTISDRSVRVKQVIALTPGLRAPRSSGLAGQIPLRMPKGMPRPTITAGGALTATEGNTCWVQPEGEHIAEIALEYELPLPEREGHRRIFESPLVWPELATRQETKVRIWTEAGVVPHLDVSDASPWRDRGTEVVMGQETLPSRVIAASGPLQPMRISLDEGGQTPSAPFVAERGFIQMQLDADGNQQYRARFLVRKFFARQWAIDLPTALDQCQPQLVLDGKAIRSWTRLESSPNTLRAEIDPLLHPRTTVLEISYTLPASSVEGSRPWSVALHPPVFADRPNVGPVRWQIGLTQPSAVFLLGSTPVDFQWNRQGWLLAPEPSLNAGDLERAFTGQEGDDSFVSMTFARAGLEPLQVIALPRMAWLMVCSATVLLIGLALLSAARLRAWRVWIGFVLAVALLWLGMFNQSLAAALAFGMQPGIVILAVLLAVQGLRAVRYRRRMLFMPGFTRTRPGSSLVRNKRQQPSTIDAPSMLPGSQVK